MMSVSTENQFIPELWRTDVIEHFIEKSKTNLKTLYNAFFLLACAFTHMKTKT